MIAMPVQAEPLMKSSRAMPAQARTATASFTASPAVQRLQETSRALNARPDVVAQRALGETLSAAAARRVPASRTGPPAARAEPPVQRTLLYPQAEWDSGKEKIREFGDDDNALINAAEPTQLPQLAEALGQTLAFYKSGAPPDLAGERINYLVGHVSFGGGGKDLQDPYWAGLGPAQIVEDLVAGNIEPGSTLKILGCLGGVSLAGKIATLLEQKGKADVSVIASPDIVHATGEGIVSFPMKKNNEQLTKAYAARNNSGKKLVKQMAEWRAQIRALRAKRQQLTEAARLEVEGGADENEVGTRLKAELVPINKEVNALLNTFVEASGEHFDKVVAAFSAGYNVQPSHETPRDQGWTKFFGDEIPREVTEADARPDRPAPVEQQPELMAELQPDPLVGQQLDPPDEQQLQEQLLAGVGAANDGALGWVDATHNHPLM
jgi:hypothetical protein